PRLCQYVASTSSDTSSFRRNTPRDFLDTDHLGMTIWPWDIQKGYFRRDAQLGFDIRRNAHATSSVDGVRHPIFSNSVGCADERDLADFQSNRWIYFGGNSFTCRAPYQTKFAFERLTGIKAAKCGISHTGTRHEFEKTAQGRGKFGTPLCG